MLDPYLETDLLVAIAVAVFIVPATFLAAVAYAGSGRMGNREIGPGLSATLSLLGGLSAGTLVLMAPELAIAAPLVLVVGAIAVSRIRARRFRQAGWVLLGAGFPLAMVLIKLVSDSGSAPAGTVPMEVLTWLGCGAVVTIIGAGLILRGDPPPPASRMAAPAGQPGSRAIGSIAAAIREPSMVGPFGLPELAILSAFVFVWLTVPFLIPRDAHFLIQLVVPSVISAVVATEAYIRAMPPRTRRAFEAFSWLGEWELARARRMTGGGVPSSPGEAIVWLEGRPERLDRLDEAALRVEILLLAELQADARALVDRMAPRATTPWERFEVDALDDLVDWRGGGEGDLAGMERAAAEVLPRDGDDRLRAEVTIAVARVRRRMADATGATGSAVEPLLEVRPLLGTRADGQVGRALRRRLIPVLLVSSVLFGLVSGFFSSGGPAV